MPAKAHPKIPPAIPNNCPLFRRFDAQLQRGDATVRAAWPRSTAASRRGAQRSGAELSAARRHFERAEAELPGAALAVWGGSGKDPFARPREARQREKVRSGVTWPVGRLPEVAFRPMDLAWSLLFGPEPGNVQRGMELAKQRMLFWRKGVRITFTQFSCRAAANPQTGFGTELRTSQNRGPDL